MSARIYTTRRLKSASGADIKGTTGKYIRVRIHKETRAVSKVNPSVWPDEAINTYSHRYPNDIDVKKCRKKVDKSKIKKKAPPIEEEKDDCPICQCELPKATTTLECGHSYCTKCILTWFQRKNSCPMCRAEVPEAAGQKGPRRTLNLGWTRAIIENTNRGIENSYAVVPARHILASRTRRWGNAGSNYAVAVLANLSDALENANDELYDRMCPVYNPNT
jgi:hypothetical protein